MSITGPNGVVLPAVTNVGDFLNPLNWKDSSGNTPPLQFNNVDPDTNYPNNGDGRFWWSVNAYAPSGLGVITFIGNAEYLINDAALTWQITDGSQDGSVPQLKYSLNGGSSWATVSLADTMQMGLITIPLAGATGFQFQVVSYGGTPSSSAQTWQVAIAITRQDQPPVASVSISTSDGPEVNGLDPYNYNPQVNDPLPYDNLSTLQTRMLVALGFSAQQANPTPGMTGFITEKLQAAQNYLYRKYPSLQLRHFFRYKLIPNQRFYSIYDNDEDVNANINATGFVLDPFKEIEWAGGQDVRNVWWPVVRGIDPTLYTMINKPWRPARFEIRQTAIEIYPSPDQTYWLWLKASAGMTRFTQATDIPNVDSELVYMYALATAKAHFGQQDAGQVLGQAKDYLGELVAGTHSGRRYIPATNPIPPAIRPTLISYIPNGT
jgi:hypothetical protein